MTDKMIFVVYLACCCCAQSNGIWFEKATTTIAVGIILLAQLKPINETFNFYDEKKIVSWSVTWCGGGTVPSCHINQNRDKIYDHDWQEILFAGQSDGLGDLLPMQHTINHTREILLWYCYLVIRMQKFVCKISTLLNVNYMLMIAIYVKKKTKAP